MFSFEQVQKDASLIDLVESFRNPFLEQGLYSNGSWVATMRVDPAENGFVEVWG